MGYRSSTLALTLALAGAFATPPEAADLDAGGEKAVSCTPCHGEGGISQMPQIPSLAGQPDLFLQWQLIFFRSGTRKNEAMQPIVDQLSNEDIRNLGAYFASLPPPPPAAEDASPALAEAGAKAAAGRRCAACHTDTYAGTKATARLASQREDYLVKALKDYKAGVRSGGGMAAMADVAYPLGEEEIAALAHYLARL